MIPRSAARWRGFTSLLPLPPRIATLAIALLIPAFSGWAQPMHVYLTWRENTARSITINYQTHEEDPTPASPPPTLVYLDDRPRNGEVRRYRHKIEGTSFHFVGQAAMRRIHQVDIDTLKAGKTYYFICGDEVNGFSEEKKFRTVPTNPKVLRFVTGGDMSASPRARQMMALAGQQNPMFGMIGGDIAYENGDLRLFGNYDAWLTNWEDGMVTPDGAMIPMALAIGNHEVQGGYNGTREKAPFYFDYFPQDAEKSYFTRRFGKYAVVFFLDSGHVSPHGGEQALWLENEMSKYRKFRYKFAVYHVPLYSSYRPFDDVGSAQGRENWAPIFDKYHLTMAFENHDHTYKRSKPLKANQADPNGTVYLGDGCFGQNPRVVPAEPRWYLDRAEGKAHFWIVEVTKKTVTCRAMDENGVVFDTFSTAGTPVRSLFMSGADEEEDKVEE